MLPIHLYLLSLESTFATVYHNYHTYSYQGERWRTCPYTLPLLFHPCSFRVFPSWIFCSKSLVFFHICISAYYSSNNSLPFPFTFSNASQVFSSCEYPSHFTESTCSNASLFEGPLAIFFSIFHSASSASISTTSFSGFLTRYRSSKRILNVGWIYWTWVTGFCNSGHYVWLTGFWKVHISCDHASCIIRSTWYFFNWASLTLPSWIPESTFCPC